MFAKIFKTNKKAIDGLTKILVERQEELNKLTQETKDNEKKPKNTFSNLKQAIVNFFRF